MTLRAKNGIISGVDRRNSGGDRIWKRRSGTRAASADLCGLLSRRGLCVGAELWQFFGSFGGGGLLGVLAAMALLAVFGLALMYIISRTGIAEMDAVLVPWERLAWLRKLSSALQLILLFGVIAIMYAGGGALLEQLFSLPTCGSAGR